MSRGLDAPDRNAPNINDFIVASEPHSSVITLRQYVEDNLPKFIPEQRAIYDTLLQAIAYNSGGVYFLDAPGGRGKTFLITVILASIRSNNEIASAMASLGIAATLLDGGKTAHSALKLPLDLHNQESPVCGVSKGSHQRTILRTCDIIIYVPK